MRGWRSDDAKSRCDSCEAPSRPVGLYCRCHLEGLSFLGGEAVRRKDLLSD